MNELLDKYNIKRHEKYEEPNNKWCYLEDAYKGMKSLMCCGNCKNLIDGCDMLLCDGKKSINYKKYVFAIDKCDAWESHRTEPTKK